MKISVNTYSTRSPTAKVEYKIGEEGKWLQLDQKTDWNWAGTYPAEDLQGAKSHKITFRVLLGNEDLFTRSGYFLFSEKNDKDYSRESSNKTVRPPTYGNNEENTLQLAWVSNAGANIWMCSPVYENGTVYIATLDEFSGENNYIAAFDAKSGEPDWKYRINSPVKNSISIDNGIVFATDQEGTAYAINGRTGSLVWKRDLGRTSLQGYISGGVIYEGVYYTGYGNYLSALDISDGRVLWKNDSWNGGFFDSNVSYTGSYSYRIEDNSATSNTEGRTRELIPVNNIDSYRLSWAARSLEEGQRYVVGVECYNQEKELIAFENRFEIYTGQTEWKSERLNLGTFNDEIMYLRIRLFPSEKTITGEHTGTVWFDEISLYNTNTGQNEFPAGNFEVNPDAIDILLDFADFNEAGRRYFDDYGFNGYRLSLKGLGGGTYYSRTNGIFEGFEQGTDEYGILIWETTYWNSTEASPPGYLQNPWEEPMSFVTGYGWPMGKQTIWGNGGGRFFYPFNRDPNNDPATYTGKPVPSLRLEILRDGIEDYEYFVLLEKLVSSPKNRNRKIVEEARELLTLPEEIYSDEKTYSKNPQDILEYRKKIAEYILKLMK